MKKYYHEFVTTHLELSLDFTGLSELLLGQAQPAQFQSAGQTGYPWCSNVSDDGQYTALNSCTTNSHTSIPRSYADNSGRVVYNWYAVVAESGDSYSTSNASDSICPSGWELPIHASGNDGTGSAYRSWLNLLIGSYSMTNNSAEASQTARKNPIAIWITGFYDLVGQYPNSAQGRYWTRTAHPFYSNYVRVLHLTGDDFQTTGGSADSQKTNGLSARCVQKAVTATP